MPKDRIPRRLHTYLGDVKKPAPPMKGRPTVKALLIELLLYVSANRS